MNSEADKEQMIELPDMPSVDSESGATKKSRAPKMKKLKVEKAKKTKKASKAARGQSTSKSEKLVCRYCGSDDLPPSFVKRRDARCRACFKKRYGSSAQSKKPPGKSAEASK